MRLPSGSGELAGVGVHDARLLALRDRVVDRVHVGALAAPDGAGSGEQNGDGLVVRHVEEVETRGDERRCPGQVGGHPADHGVELLGPARAVPVGPVRLAHDLVEDPAHRLRPDLVQLGPALEDLVGEPSRHHAVAVDREGDVFLRARPDLRVPLQRCTHDGSLPFLSVCPSLPAGLRTITHIAF